MASSVLLLVVLHVGLAVGYQSYQLQIPNGGNVPDPCNPGSAWPGVGHRNIGGGGSKNKFGNDFSRNSSWAALCRLDSDGDGRTNGEELGDPQCTWTVGSPTPVGTTLTHPSICEPICSTSCRTANSGLQCNAINNCPTSTQPATTTTTPAPGAGTTTTIPAPGSETPSISTPSSVTQGNCGCGPNCRPVLSNTGYVCDCNNYSPPPSSTCANVRCSRRKACAMVQGKCRRGITYCPPTPQCLGMIAANGIPQCPTNIRCPRRRQPTTDVCGCSRCPGKSDGSSGDDSAEDDNSAEDD